MAATEEEAAEAYDIAAIKFRGGNAVTNFEMNRYDVEAIAKSPLPVGGTAKRLKLSLEAKEKPPMNANLQVQSSSNSINFASLQQPVSTIPCGLPFDVNFFHHLHPTNAGSSIASGAVPTMLDLEA
ncbi:AP2-like ethylene-responsive transcription factor AIL6 [Forsythia ovata]|uniref:AP2-like ethylene-responsive transcription factor AIL6 n=1 Tax=Forsythia ovata TaxID=205694 RepID=A0ABD1U9X6_9LAMI